MGAKRMQSRFDTSPLSLYGCGPYRGTLPTLLGRLEDAEMHEPTLSSPGTTKPACT